MDVDLESTGRSARRRSKRLAVLSLAAWAALGPGPAHAEVRLGALGGVGFTTLHQSGENFATYDDRFVTRAAGGGVIDVSWSGRTSLRLEPLFAVKGSRYQDPACPCLRPPGYVPRDNDLHLSYVEVPVLAVVTLDGGRWHRYLAAGVVPGIMTGARNSRDGQEYDTSSSYEGWDLGVSLGGGLTYAASRARPFVEARLTVSALAVDDESRRNVAVHVLFGVSFAVGRPPSP